MEIKDIMTALKELVLPELKEIRHEQAELKTALNLTNKRLDDINIHLADQSRRLDETNQRIDAVREDLIGRLDETNKRIDTVREELSERLDETNKCIDTVRADLTGRIDMSRAELTSHIDDNTRRIDETNKRIDENSRRIDSIQGELSQRIIAVHNDVILRIDKTNDRLNRLYEAIVRRNEHEELKKRLDLLEQDLSAVKQRFAA